jgi:DNA-binding LacI/PurR family transcriptional regulator
MSKGQTVGMRRLSIVDQCELELEKGVREGTWGRLLPGYRFLSETLGVSIPTVTRAAERLVQRGLLRSQGPRRALQVIAGPAGENPAAVTTTRGLMILLEKPWAELSPNTRAILEGCGEAAKANGMPVHYAHMAYVDAVRQRRSWDRVLKAHPCSHVLVTMGSDPVVEWAKERGLKVSLLGGATHHKEVPVFGVRLPELLAHALAELRRSGHERILVPCIGLQRLVADTVAAEVSRAMGVSAKQLAHEGLLIHEPAMENDAAVARVIRGFRETGATAMLAINYRSYQLYATGMMQAGIRIPDDISTVLLMGDPEVTYIRPKPAHFEPPLEMIRTRVKRWLLKGVRSQAEIGGSWLKKAWREGQTVREV